MSFNDVPQMNIPPPRMNIRPVQGFCQSGQVIVIPQLKQRGSTGEIQMMLCIIRNIQRADLEGWLLQKKVLRVILPPPLCI